MHFGFSYVGVIFLIMLFVPNIIWTKHQPEDYDKYVKNENKTLLTLERAGEVLVCAIVVMFSDFNVQGISLWLLWLIAALILMILYEVFWIRYFRSDHTMLDFYSSILGIPVAGASIPVIVVFLIAIYGKNPLLFIAGIILGIGHIGIHLQHRKEALEAAQQINTERE